MSRFLRIMHFFNHGALLFGLMHYSWQFLWLSLVGWFFYGCFGISICFHRQLSHKSFQFQNHYVKKLSVLLGCLATGGSPLSWVGAHRLHHSFADQPKDPHSLRVDGFLRTYFHLWRSFIIPRSMIKDLLRDKFLIFIHRQYVKIILGYVFILLLIDIKMAIFLYCAPAVISFHAFGIINTFGHSHGYRSYEVVDTSSNSWFANILTWGEGWHNNHHRYPRSHRIGLRRHEVDIGAWCIENLPFFAKGQRDLNL